jgi:hypothetical protein
MCAARSGSYRYFNYKGRGACRQRPSDDHAKYIYFLIILSPLRPHHPKGGVEDMVFSPPRGVGGGGGGGWG